MIDKDPSLAPVVLLNKLRILKQGKRVKGLEKARHLTRTSSHSEAVIFNEILNVMFGSEDKVEASLGKPLLISTASDKELALGKVIETREDGNTHFNVVVSPEEYEWLTINLESFDWNENEGEPNPGRILGRYYRLLLATNHILDTRGETNLSHPAFRTTLNIGEEQELEVNPEKCGEYASVLRLAGATALFAMSLEESTERSLVDYLQFSIAERITYALKSLEFAKELDVACPPDLDQDLPHWKGVCLPVVDIEDIRYDELWVPSQNS